MSKEHGVRLADKYGRCEVVSSLRLEEDVLPSKATKAAYTVRFHVGNNASYLPTALHHTIMQ